MVVPSLLWALGACAADETSSGAGGTSSGGTSSGGTSSGGGGAGGAATGRCPSGLAPDPDVAQALPQSSVDTSYVAPLGATIPVAAGGDFQAALDAAQPGDVITLEAGATFQGPFTLPAKAGSDTIVVRTSAGDDALPAPGQRVDPSFAAVMPKIVVAANIGSALVTATGAHHYRFIGVEIAPTAGSFVYTLVAFGNGETTEADLPHHLIIDRCYLHGDPAAGSRRGVGLNSKHSAVIDSYLADFKENGGDSQAIAGWNGSGPFKIVNNHLEGAAENIMFGGADPSVPNLVPSDIEICGNHIVKPTAWRDAGWSAKNLFELKNARRVLLAGNVLENSWANAQVGFAIVLTPRNQDGTAPWCTIEDLTIAYNVIRHSGSGIAMAGEDDLHPSQQQQRVVIRDNLLDDVNRDAWGGDGRLFQVTSPSRPTVDVKVDHNTATMAGNAFLVAGDTGVVGQGFRFTNNIVPHGDYGAFGSGQGEGNSAFAFYFPGIVCQKNVLLGSTAASYPADNFFPSTMADVGFVDLAGGNLALDAGSPYRAAGTDGKDVGADWAGLQAATIGAAP